MSTEAKVGAFVLSCFAVLAFTVIYLLNAQFSGGTVPYRTYLRYAGGLEPGASVLYGGINVGRVTAVRPWAENPTRIEILLEIKKGTPLNEKCVAKLGFVSVMNSAALNAQFRAFSFYFGGSYASVPTVRPHLRAQKSYRMQLGAPQESPGALLLRKSNRRSSC